MLPGSRGARNQTQPPTPGLALVTGASSGIGRELAAEFALRDWDLLICAEDAGIDRAAESL
ncbi:MAG: oxidoreductase, partial [Streptomycetaceae bacterium]|nr:oxidoreductase [Streptomycetaceae bacterium]